VRNTKSLLAFLVCLVLLALMLSACGGSTTTTTSAQATRSVTTPPSSTSTPSTTAAQTTTTKPAVPTTVALSAPTVAGTLVFQMAVGDNDDDICVVNTDGTGLKTLAHGGEPTWSPNGSKIVYTVTESAGAGQFSASIWVMNADGSGKKELYGGSLADGQATWSPDGTQIAWSGWTSTHAIGTTNDRSAIFVMNADGTNPHNITSKEGAGLDYWPTWATDGKIHFVRVAEPGVFSRAFRVNPDGSGLEELKTVGDAHFDFMIYAVSPDGTRVAFEDLATAPNRLVVVPASGAGDPVTVLEPIKGYLGGQPAYASWSSDGKALAITGVGARGYTPIFIVSADGTGLSMVPGIDKAFEPSWRP
jgi:Tol biopolymer transport system component